jgi:hypothetical protein
MKLFFGVSVSIAVALAFGIYLTHRSGAPPGSATMSASVSPPAPQAAAPGLRTSPDEAAGASSAVTGNSRRVDTPQQEMATLRDEVALLRREVSAIAAAGSTRRAAMQQMDIAALRKEVSALQRQIREQWRAGTVVARGRAESPAHDQGPDPAAHAEEECDRQAQMAVLEANFWQEPADHRWSAEAAGAVQQALTSDGTIQTALRSLECRSHPCRLEMANDDTGELAKFLPVFLLQLAQTLPNVMANQVDDGNGSRSMILYMTSEANEAAHRGK